MPFARFTYQDLLNPDHSINEVVQATLIRSQAAQDQEACKRQGLDRPYARSLRIATDKVTQIAESMRSGALAQLEQAKKPLKVQLVESLELELRRARDGMAQPLNPDLMARIEADLVHAREALKETEAA